MKQKILNTKIQRKHEATPLKKKPSTQIPQNHLPPPLPPPQNHPPAPPPTSPKPSNRPAHLHQSRARAQGCGPRSICRFLLDAERRWRSHSAGAPPKKLPGAPQ
jgi:hypothetical protein